MPAAKRHGGASASESQLARRRQVRIGIRDRRVVLTTVAVLIGGGSSVLACPVCFGAEETSMIDGTKLGVLVMLAITFAVQGGFVAFFLYLRKRAKRIADVELDTEWSELQRGVENIMTEWLGLPPLASAHGGQIDSLIGWTHVFMFVLFVGWGAFFVYALIRFRRSRNPVANYTGVTSHTSNYLEVAVALVEVVLLFAFSIPLWAARVDRMPADSEALVVQVTARAVRLEHPLRRPRRRVRPHRYQADRRPGNPLGLDRTDPAAKDDVTTLNQLYLPVNKPIIVRLRSKDVIHSFGVPEFRVKQDAVPGLTIPIWFVPNVTTAEMRTRTGNPEFQYEIACAQLCGLGHYRMRGLSPSRAPRSSRSGWRTSREAQGAGRGSVQVTRTAEDRNSQLPTPNSQLPIPNSRLPTPRGLTALSSCGPASPQSSRARRTRLSRGLAPV